MTSGQQGFTPPSPPQQTLQRPLQSPLLEVADLRTSFITSGGIVQAVRGVSFTVERGEFLGVVGESGSGKSVTMVSVMRLLPDNAALTARTLSFDGKDLLLASSKQVRGIQGNEIGMIFQDPMTSLNPLFSIERQLTEPLCLHLKMGRKAARRRAVEMLELAGIPDPEHRLRQYPHEFSGGMRQRVMIAMAMCCNPRLLIADEPTTALDVTIQAQILDLMADLKTRFSTATILITHDLGVIASICSRVIVMYGGLIMEEGLVEDIFYRPLHPYTRGLLRSVPNVSKDEKEKLIPILGSPPDLVNPPAGCPFAARCTEAMRICAAARPEFTVDGGGAGRERFLHRAACWALQTRRQTVVPAVAAVVKTAVETAAGAAPPPPPPWKGGVGGDSTLLEVKRLEKSFTLEHSFGQKRGKKILRAVNGVSFGIERGSTFGLVGESGCGKSTIGRTLLKLYPATGGSIVYNGVDITALGEKDFFPYRRKMQMIFQDPYTSLDPRQPVSEIIGAPLSRHRLTATTRERNERVIELLRLVGLKQDHMNRYPHEFSGGQRQRIGIARALAVMPEFIVCDEPISALDVSIQAQIINLLEDFQNEFGFTYLFISHDLTMIRHISRNVGVMYLGHIVEIADVEEIYAHMGHPYTRSLMSAAPVADPSASKTLRREILKGDVPSPLDPPSGCPFRTRCGQASPRCAEEPPVLHEISPGHFTACHHPL